MPLSVCTTGDKDELFDMVAADIRRHYDTQDIKAIISSSDGALCYKNHSLIEDFPEASFAHCLDPFHISRALTIAFPDKALRSKLLSMVYAQEIESFCVL